LNSGVMTPSPRTGRKGRGSSEYFWECIGSESL
jgi:hypothetical protein